MTRKFYVTFLTCFWDLETSMNRILEVKATVILWMSEEY